MNLSELSPAPGSRHTKRRLGRGIGSGLGKTSGKGHKGQNARSGGGVRPGFEGGQMPLTRRIPKMGFTPHARHRYAIVNLERLGDFAAGTVVTPDLLVSEGVLHRTEARRVKILGVPGEAPLPALTVRAHAFSAKAREAIESAGGTVEVL